MTTTTDEKPSAILRRMREEYGTTRFVAGSYWMHATCRGCAVGVLLVAFQPDIADAASATASDGSVGWHSALAAAAGMDYDAVAMLDAIYEGAYTDACLTWQHEHPLEGLLNNPVGLRKMSTWALSHAIAAAVAYLESIGQ